MGLGVQRHASVVLPPENIPYSSYRRLGGPPGPSGQVGKISPPPVFFPRTVQLVASRYTDWAIPTHTLYDNSLNLCFGSTRFEPVLFLTGRSMGVFSPTSRVSWMVPLNTCKLQPGVSILVGCSVVSGERFRTFQSFACFSSWGLLALVGEGDTLLRNVANHSPSARASHRRIVESSATPLWESQISQATHSLLLPNPVREFLVSKHVQAGPEAHSTSTGVISGGKAVGAWRPLTSIYSQG
jgi:hypothetical protein